MADRQAHPADGRAGGLGGRPDDGPPDAPRDDDAPRPEDAPTSRGLRVLGEDDFSFADAVGGVRGVVETSLPGVVFVVVYLVAHALVPALVAAGATTLVAVVLRLVQRTPVTQALSGVLGVGIGVVWAWRSGEAQNFFAWGLVVNAVWFVGSLVSILVRWPAVGVITALLRDEGTAWRTGRSPAEVHLRRRYTWATWLWVGVFGARLAVQLPMWLRGEEAVAWLGTARLAMGVPLFALGIWITWLLVASPGARAESAGRPRRPRR